MKSLRGSISLDKQFSGQYRRLFRNLGLLMLIMLALGITAVAYFDKKQVKDLSSKLISNTTAAIEEKFMSFFETANRNLRVAIEQLQMAREPDGELMKALFLRLSPFLNQYQNISGIIITEVSSANRYLGILKPKPGESEFLVRKYFPEEWGNDRARLELWKNGKMLESWIRKDDFVPKTRPWFKDALQAAENEIVTSKPYSFHTVQKPGITLSTRWRKPDTGGHFIAAVDITLSAISRFTQTMRPTENGVAFILTQDLRLVGPPADGRFSDDNMLNAVLLKSVGEVDIPILQASAAEWEQRGRTRQSFPFEFEGRRWWAGFEWNEDHPEHMRFWTGILVPESDFLGQMSLQRNISLAAIFGLGLLLGLVMTVNAVRKIRHDLREAVSHIGRKLGPFELVYKIGGGGNGTVYRAQHALLKRPTAVKVMLPQFARSESAKKRFHNEVQITSSLSHPNTIAVFDFGQTPEGTLYYAMEHLSGVTLEDLVRIFGPQPAARVAVILDQVCGSLKEAHARGMIHRDIKPTNIMLCEHGGLNDVVKVLDFGLVKDVQQNAPDVTQANAIVGTPFYLAPELITDAKVFSPASDLYALGGVGYYLLTGRNVFEGASAMEICAMHLHDEPLPPSRRISREIPPDLEAVVMACLAKQPADRPQSAEKMSEMLTGCKAYGAWSQKEAKQWWSSNRSSLPIETHADTHSPLSDTGLLLDRDGRR